MIKVVYTLFLGILLALFIGFGVASFYEAPKMPDYPIKLSSSYINEPTDAEITERTTIENNYEKEQKEYRDAFSKYNKTASAVIMGLAVLLVVIGLLLLPKIDIISDGLVLGGVFTLFYGMIRGFMTEDPKYGFMAVSVGLLVTLVLGWMKFVRPEKK